MKAQNHTATQSKPNQFKIIRLNESKSYVEARSREVVEAAEGKGRGRQVFLRLRRAGP